MNVCKIDTRPASTVVKIFDQTGQPSDLWDYLFYIDFTTNDGLESIQQVLLNLKQYTVSLRDFGVFQPYDSTELARIPSVDQTAVPWTAYL